MENSEEILQMLERFTEQKAKQIPKKLDDYLEYVARTGDSVFDWSNIKYLLREKLLHAIKNFNENIARIEDIPTYPNVDPFNFETMESLLLERFELFNAAPFTIQRLCELLVEPRKHYSRIDKYMRALEKNILVVTTVKPGRMRDDETANGDVFDGLDVDIELDEQDEQRVMEIAQKILVENKLATNDELSQEPSVETEQEKKEDDEEQPKPKKLKIDESTEELNTSVSVEAESQQETSLPEAKENSAEEKQIDVESGNIETEKQVNEIEEEVAKDNTDEHIPTLKTDSPTMTEIETEIPKQQENVQHKIEEQITEREVLANSSDKITSTTPKEEQPTYTENPSDTVNQVEQRDLEESREPLEIAADQEPIPAEERPTYSETTTEIDVNPVSEETVVIVTKEEKEVVDDKPNLVVADTTEPEEKISEIVLEPMEADELEIIRNDESLDEMSSDSTANTNMDIDRDDVAQQQDEAME